jgi:predicted hydrocarbon binding protein
LVGCLSLNILKDNFGELVMERRKFLTHTCGLGACACSALLLLSEQEAIAAGENEGKNTQEKLEKGLHEELGRLRWWSKHAQNQIAKLMELLQTHLDEKTRIGIMEQMGRNCAKSIGWAEKYRGNVEGFFQYMNNHNGETFTYDKEKGVITIVTRVRDCDCRLVDSKKTPPYYCYCSAGWQKYTYETILGKSVDVKIKESVLFGQPRCVFEVTVGADLPA